MAMYKATLAGRVELTPEEEAARLAEIEALEEQQAEQVIVDARNNRNQLLTDSDWTQMPDTPLTEEQKTAWAIYRQALRDITTHENFPNLEESDYPVKPE